MMLKKEEKNIETYATGGRASLRSRRSGPGPEGERPSGQDGRALDSPKVNENPLKSEDLK